MSRILIYFTFLLIGGLSACSDHRVPAVAPGSTTTRLRVKTLTLDLPDNKAKVSLFRYDAQGRLSSILTYQTPDSTVSEIEYSNYQYDGQNRLTELRREAVLHPRGSGPNLVERYLYTYNAAGRVSEVDNVNGFSVRLSYGADNRLVSASRGFRTGGLIISGSDSFTFTGNNLTAYQTGFTIAGHGGPAFSGGGSSSTFTHDDKINPFYGVYVIPAPFPNGFINLTFSPRLAETYFGGTDNVLNLSENNVLNRVFAVSSGASSVTNQYQYNAANLPTVRVRTTTITNSFGTTVTVETLRFGYESY